MVIQAGKLAGNAIVPYNQSTKRTKEVVLTATAIGSTVSVQEIVGYAYADSNNAWWLHFAGRVTITTTEAILVFTLSGIQVREISLLADGYWVGGSGAGNVGIGGAAYSFANNHTTKANYIQISPASSNSTFVFDSFIPLESEPTWAAANMEASTNGSFYMQPASPTADGIMNQVAQGFAGVKTFDDGINLGGSNLSSFVESSWSPTWGAGANVDSVTTHLLYYSKIGSFVTVAGTVNIDVTTALTVFQIVFIATNLPYAIKSGTKVTGEAYRIGNPRNTGHMVDSAGYIYLNGHDNNADTGDAPWAVSFTYRTDS